MNASKQANQQALCTGEWIAVTESLCQHIIEVARSRAYRCNMRSDEAIDAANSFLLHVLERPEQFLRPGTHGLASEAWLFRCADNWVKNWKRHSRRQRRRELPLIQPSRDESDSSLRELPGNEPAIDLRLIRAELRWRVRIAIILLPPSQQRLFLRYFVQGQSIEEIAHASHQKANAVRQALWALRNRMRTLLTQGGLDEAEAREYLQILQTQ